MSKARYLLMFRRCLANRIGYGKGLQTFRNSAYVDIFYDKQWGGTVAGSKRTIYLRAGLCCGRCLRLILKIQGRVREPLGKKGKWAGVVSFYVTFFCLMPHVANVAAGAGGGR